MGRKATFSTAQVMLSLQSYFADAKGSEETSNVASRTDLDLDFLLTLRAHMEWLKRNQERVSRFQKFV